MTQCDKFRAKLLGGRGDQGVDFDRLCAYPRRLGFEETTEGSHHVFGRADIDQIIVLQPRSDGSAKPYQVRQVRSIFRRYGL